jgi:hypothetical protein
MDNHSLIHSLDDRLDQYRELKKITRLAHAQGFLNRLLEEEKSVLYVLALNDMPELFRLAMLKALQEGGLPVVKAALDELHMHPREYDPIGLFPVIATSASTFKCNECAKAFDYGEDIRRKQCGKCVLCRTCSESPSEMAMSPLHGRCDCVAARQLTTSRESTVRASHSPGDSGRKRQQSVSDTEGESGADTGGHPKRVRAGSDVESVGKRTLPKLGLSTDETQREAGGKSQSGKQ